MESNHNPYVAPQHTADTAAASRGSSVIAFARKVLLTCVWTLLFFFGSAILLGFASGIYFVNTSSSAGGPSQQTIQLIGFTGAVIPIVLGSIGILLGILGYLPGTRWAAQTKFNRDSKEAEP
ncbi:hypothetical protein CA13_17850 [Planctomycetes bacterium CA13]|uniref:Uncharacterized protein n=1 Tax=Novipirellula herctigrandis TaxID=2527986 RepID=A0A5C5YZ40_9BACT|nr:hypothetical protein CA13_17850 [Planctomycetes bacterium CA13]